MLMMICAGAVAGLLAGLFGIGGGMILVPAILTIMNSQNIPSHGYAQHLAIGSSFAVMMFTSFSSTYAQYRKKSVAWQAFFALAPALVLGAIVGAVVAQYVPNFALQIIFVIFATTVAVRSLLNITPKATHQLPKNHILWAIGTFFGILSSLVGIGGGSLVVPFLVYCNIDIHRAVGTSSALGWIIAITGAVGYAYSGFSVPDLPPHSLGFIYLPVVPILALTTVIFAPIGVRLSHRLSSPALKKGFGILLLFIAGKMLLRVFASA